MSVALVLSGGGSKGDFELGAILYLYRVRNIQPTLITGTSVGAINGAKLAEGEGSPDSGLRGLERTWFTLDRNDDMWRFEAWVRNAPPEVSRMINAAADTHLFSRKLPGQPSILPRDNVDAAGLRDIANAITGFAFLMGAGITLGPTVTAATQASSVANLEPIRDRIFGRNGFPALFNPSLVAQWAAAGRKLRLASVSLDSGELRFVSETGQMLDRNGQPAADRTTRQLIFCDVREAIIASASIGVVFPPVKLGSEYYVDGGHRTVIPVDPIFDPAFGIQTAYLVSASPIGLNPASFEQTRTLGNIASRALFETFLAEIVRSETSPRGGWGPRSVTLIAPSMEVHAMVKIDPGLIRINVDYGWMRADDAVNGRGPGDRLFDLSNEITWHRTRIWFNEGRYLGLFGNVGLGEYPNLPSYRIDLQRLIDERRRLGGSLPPGAERWPQIGEAHSTGNGGAPIVNLTPFDGAAIATALSDDGQPILVLIDSMIGDSILRSSAPNDLRRVVYSTRHQEPLVAGTIGWRVAGRSQLPAFAQVSCVQAGPGSTLLLAADEDGTIVRAESVPDGNGFTGWLPLLDGRTAPGGSITGVSRHAGSFDLFAVGTDGRPYTAARHAGAPNWGGWWTLPAGSFIPGSRISAVSRSADKLDIFAADSNGNIVTAAWEPGGSTWGGWWGISGGRTAPGGHIAVISCAPDVLDVFVVGTDGHVYRTFWSPATHPWSAWTSLATAGLRFASGAPIAITSPTPGRMVVALTDTSGRVHATSLIAPIRTFPGFTQIGTLTFAANANVSLISLPGGEVQAFAVGTDRRVYMARLPAGSATAWSDWTAQSGSIATPIYIPPGTDAPFRDGMLYGTTDPADQIEVRVEENAMAADTVEFVLNAGPGIDWRKEIVIVEGVSAGTGRWTIVVINNQNTDRNGLYAYQLPGARLEFRKAKFLGVMTEVSRIGIDKVKPGSRITFTWVRD